MEDDSKKTNERRIFDLVYADRSLSDVTAHENPDFLVRLSPNSPYFGVEVTEYFVSESSARLDRIEGYMAELLDGGKFRHKLDADRLEVLKVDIVKPDDTVHAKNVPMVMQQLPPVAECAREIANRIIAKGKRIQNSTAEMTHANLIIDDRSGVLRTTAQPDFYRSYFQLDMIDAVRNSPFREIYLITTLDGEAVYASLKMLYLFAWSGATQFGVANGCITAPYWFGLLWSAMFAVAHWVRWSNRFSLRTRLIATTIVVGVLGWSSTSQ